MSKLEVIQDEIEALPPEDYAQLRKWFGERDWKAWDKQIEADSASGKLDFLLEEARDAKGNYGAMREPGIGCDAAGRPG